MDAYPKAATRSYYAAVLGLIAGMVGFFFVSAGQDVTGKWAVISTSYRICGLGWILVELAMIASGAWTLLVLGRNRIALCLSAVASVLAGCIMVAGVMSSTDSLRWPRVELG